MFSTTNVSDEWKVRGFKRMLSYEQYPEEKSRFWLSSFKKNWSTSNRVHIIQIPSTAPSFVGICAIRNPLKIHCYTCVLFETYWSRLIYTKVSLHRSVVINMYVITMEWRCISPWSFIVNYVGYSLFTVPSYDLMKQTLLVLDWVWNEDIELFDVVVWKLGDMTWGILKVHLIASILKSWGILAIWLVLTGTGLRFTHESHQLLLKRGKVSNQSDCRKMKDSFCNCLQTSSKLDQQDISTDQLVLYLSHWILLFQMGCNKVVTRLLIVQFFCLQSRVWYLRQKFSYHL